MAEQEPPTRGNLPEIDPELAALVKERLGWEYPVAKLSPEQGDIHNAITDLLALSETDFEIAEIQDLVNRILGGEDNNE